MTRKYSTTPQTKAREIALGKQDVVFKETVALTVHGRPVVLRFRIDSDSYDFQSSATVEIFNANDNTWKTLASIAYAKMITAHKLYVKKQTEWSNPDTFAVDRSVLLKQALDILEAAYAPTEPNGPSTHELLKACQTSADLLDEALDQHIYNADNGEKPEADCGYTAHVADLRALIARAK